MLGGKAFLADRAFQARRRALWHPSARSVLSPVGGQTSQGVVWLRSERQTLGPQPELAQWEGKFGRNEASGVSKGGIVAASDGRHEQRQCSGQARGERRE